MLYTAPQPLSPQQQEGVRDNRSGWQAAEVPVHSSPKGPLLHPQAPCLPWWLHRCVCVGWLHTHLGNKWYFDFVKRTVGTFSFCRNHCSFYDSCHHFSENTLCMRACVYTVLLTLHTVWMQAIISIREKHDSPGSPIALSPPGWTTAHNKRHTHTHSHTLMYIVHPHVSHRGFWVIFDECEDVFFCGWYEFRIFNVVPPERVTCKVE